MCNQNQDEGPSETPTGEPDHLAENDLTNAGPNWKRNPCFVSTDDPDWRAFRLLGPHWVPEETTSDDSLVVSCGEYRMELECKDERKEAILRMYHERAPLDPDQNADADMGLLAEDKVSTLEAAQDSAEFLDNLRDPLLEEAFEMAGEDVESPSDQFGSDS